MKRGEVWWASLPEPLGSGPGARRPVLIVQANSFNGSRIQTVIVAVITSNVLLAEAPGNVLLRTKHSGLPKDSVVKVSRVLTIDKRLLTDPVGAIPSPQMAAVDAGLRLSLNL